jgi:hypothetical protein
MRAKLRQMPVEIEQALGVTVHKRAPSLAGAANSPAARERSALE